jgi:hypothetical protein
VLEPFLCALACLHVSSPNLWKRFNKNPKKKVGGGEIDSNLYNSNRHILHEDKLKMNPFSQKWLMASFFLNPG